MQEEISKAADTSSLGFTQEQIATIRERRRVQEAISRSGDTDTAAAQIEAIMGKIKIMQPERMKLRQTAQKPILPSRAECLDMLKVGGYPDRTIEDLGVLYGPGLKKAEELLPDAIAGDRIIFVRGDCGTGKTVMVAFWALHRALAGKSPGRYVALPELLSRFKSSYDAKPTENEEAIIRYYQTKPMVVIDEAQDRMQTPQSREWSDNLLNQIVRHRHDSRLFTVFILNCDSENKVKGLLTDQIVSRAEMKGYTVNCDWPSYRGAQQ
jgi:hypothetical protein